MEKRKYDVTCWYCEFLGLLEMCEDGYYKCIDPTYCLKKEGKRNPKDEICEFFKIRSGLFTKKNYPNKVEENRRRNPLYKI